MEGRRVARDMTARNIRGLRIKTKCVTNEELVRWFHRFCDDASIFIATTSPRPEGLDTAFSIDLASGEPALAGEGVVLAAWTTRDNRYKAPGMQIGVRTLTKPSQAVFEQMLIARAIANDSTPPSQESWDEGTEVSAPTFDALALGNAEPVPGVPAVGKQTVLGMPSIPRTPESPSKEAMKPPAKDDAANKNGSVPASRAQSKLGPNAFSFSVPAKIEPTGAMKRLEKPVATKPEVAASAPAKTPEPVTASAASPEPPLHQPPRTKTIIHAGIVERVRAIEAAATPVPQAIPIVQAVEAPAAKPAPAAPTPSKDLGATIQHVAIVGPPRTAEPPRPVEVPRASTPIVVTPAPIDPPVVIARASTPVVATPHAAAAPAHMKTLIGGMAAITAPAHARTPSNGAPVASAPRPMTPVAGAPVTARPIAHDSEPPALAPPPVVDESRDESKSTRVPRAATVLGSGPVARLPAGYTPSNAYDVAMDEAEHTDVTDVDPQQVPAAPPFELDYPRVDPADLPHEHTRETKPAKSSIHVQPRKRRTLPMVLAAIVLVGLGGAAAWKFYPRAESVAAAQPEPAAAPVAMPAAAAPAPAPAAAPVEAAPVEAAPAEAPAEPAAPAAQEVAETAKPEEVVPKAAAAAPEPPVRRTAKTVKKAPVKRVSAKPAAKPRPKKKKKAAAACTGLDCL